VELNASDVRTQKAIEEALAPASTSTLESFSSNGRGNLILLDEVDGIFGREDRGGLPAILSAVKTSPIPVVLTANDIQDDRFDDLRKACLVIELHQLRPRYLVLLINHILGQEGVKVASETVASIIRRSSGDIRSAINDAQAAAAGTFDDRAARTRILDEHETLKQLFALQFADARRSLNDTEIPLYKDDLLLLLHDLIPYIYTSSHKIASAYEALSRADVAYARIGANRSRSIAPPPFNMPRRDSVPQWDLLPVALNEVATVNAGQTDNDIDQAIRTAPRVSLKTLERYQYRLWSIDHACARLAKACHTSKRTARRDILPFLVSIFRANEEAGPSIAVAMDLEERDIQFIASEAESVKASIGHEEILNPTSFKLPFMGKDKFIQLMRSGIRYDSANRRFSVRRMDNLDAVEQSLSLIVGKPMKFIRPDVEPQPRLSGDKITKVCYVDGTVISCDACEFVEDCPTHVLSGLCSCICSNTILDPNGYEKYIHKNDATKPVEKTAKSTAARKKPGSRKKATVRDRS
jgi:replication factor C large subunit